MSVTLLTPDTNTSHRVSHVSRPPGELVAALLAMLAEVSTQEAKSVWTELEGSPLLPYLALPESSGEQLKKRKPLLSISTINF